MGIAFGDALTLEAAPAASCARHRACRALPFSSTTQGRAVCDASGLNTASHSPSLRHGARQALNFHKVSAGPDMERPPVGAQAAAQSVRPEQRYCTGDNLFRFCTRTPWP